MSTGPAETCPECNGLYAQIQTLARDGHAAEEETRRLREQLHEAYQDRDALAAKIERMIAEEDRLVSRHHQHAIDRVAELEQEASRLRSLLADADKVRDERDRLLEVLSGARKLTAREGRAAK